MNDNDELRRLQEKVAQKGSYTVKLQELCSQREDLRSHAQEMEAIMYREQADVDRMEETSLSAMFYSFLGKKEEKLDKEKREAVAARAKYEAAVREVKAVEQDICWYEDALREIEGCEQRCEQILRERREAVKNSGSAAAVRMMELEKSVAGLQYQKKEIQEAVYAGEQALQTAEGILSSLNKAEGWGVVDLLGGGLLTDIAKHSHVDQAQSQMAQLQSDLRRFKTELADVTVQVDMQVSIDGFLRMADYFFDSLLADALVMDKIRQGQSKIQQTMDQIQEALRRLQAMDVTADDQIRRLRDEMDALVTSENG